MRREDLIALNAFLAVAEESSFTRAAKRLGTSQSAVSNTLRRLEERLGVRLLNRTTRKVSMTEAGERLFGSVGSAFAAVGDELGAMADMRDRPSGTVRVTAPEHAARTIVWPAADAVMAAYPEVRVEIDVEAALTDIVAERFDAGVRLGEHVAKDMVAVRIGPDVRMAAIAAPGYLARVPPPASPHALDGHACINIRTPTHGDLYAWEFGKAGRGMRMRVDGPFTCNNAFLAVEAAKVGHGIAFVPDFHARAALDEGSVVRVLADWCPAFAGYHLYFPSRRRHSSPFALLLRELRRRTARA